MKNCLRTLHQQVNPAGTGGASLAHLIFTVLAAGLLVCRADDPNGLFIKPIPAKTVVLTFDDGCLSHYTNAAPVLQSLGLPGTFFYSENWLGNSYYMTPNQVSNLNAMGFEVGNHTVNHWDMGAVNLSTCRSIVTTLDNDLAANGMTNRPTTLAYPLGHVNPAYYSGLYSLGYLFARSTATAPYRPTVDNPFNVPCYGISDSNPGDFYNALTNAITNQIVVILFHGVPDQQNPNVSTAPTNFAPMMQYLKTNNYHVIAMRDLAKYVGRISDMTPPNLSLTATGLAPNTTYYYTFCLSPCPAVKKAVLN